MKIYYFRQLSNFLRLFLQFATLCYLRVLQEVQILVIS